MQRARRAANRANMPTYNVRYLDGVINDQYSAQMITLLII